MDLNELRAPMPHSLVHWRAQSVSKPRDGGDARALALAYVDARAVMARLDAVCGPCGWQDSYVETAKGRVICTLSLKTGDGWVSKSDGAGDSDVEGEKGAISDAFKRAAVKWGVARELYDMPDVWVPCELRANDKWRKWKGDPWSYVNREPSNPAVEDAEARERFERHVSEKIAIIATIERMDEFVAFWKGLDHAIRADPRVVGAKDARKAEIEAASQARAAELKESKK